MKIYNFEQWSEERFKIRELKLTASNATAIGNCGKWLETYVVSIVSDYYNNWEKEVIYSKDIDRGNELEPIARDMYELTTWNIVKEVWFVEYNEYVWCSPDWLVWDDWGIEIKSLNNEKHFGLLSWTRKIDSWHIRQIQMNLLITGRKRWDFISYNPNYKQTLYIERIKPDKKKFDKLLEWFKVWEQMIKDVLLSIK